LVFLEKFAAGEPAIPGGLLVLIEGPLKIKGTKLPANANVRSNDEGCVALRRLIDSDAKIGLIYQAPRATSLTEPLDQRISLDIDAVEEAPVMFLDVMNQKEGRSVPLRQRT